MRVGIGQISSVVGDFERNARAILERIEEARDGGCDLVLFPELAVPGAFPLDLVRRSGFVAGCEAAIERIRTATAGVAVVVGSITHEGDGAHPEIRSCAYVFEDRATVARIDKAALAPLGPGAELRQLTPGPGLETVEVAGRSLGIILGESIDPEGIDLLARLGAEWTFSLAASPFYAGRPADRRTVARKWAKEGDVGVVFVNTVGGQDGVVFDGASFAVDRAGRLLFQAPPFEQGLFIVDLDVVEPIAEPSEDELDQIRAAIVLGIRDYAGRNGFGRVLIGLSGGVDSALVASLAVEALGSAAVIGVSLPTTHTSVDSRSDARALADSLRIDLVEIPIDAAWGALRASLPFEATGIVNENLQARTRAVLWMALANAWDALVLATGNKSEIAVGYCTLYGDTTGALAPIADLYKTDVYRLARQLGDRIPHAILDKAPSAELRPRQRDEDDLPPYEVLDPMLSALIDENLSVRELVERGFDPALVDDIVDRFYSATFKRRQLPPAILVSANPLAGRRDPLSNRFRQ